MPKIAYVFDEDVDIYDDERVKWATAWRFNPESGTVILPGQNMLPLDPSLGTDHPPVTISKVGFDCTIPLVGDVDGFAYQAAVVSEPLNPPAQTVPVSEEELTAQMEALIRAKPRTWKEILEQFAGQPYPVIYRAFGRLRPKLGRMADERPSYPYTISDSDFVYADSAVHAGDR
jgi:4-hydroxy-3-polyprenylbenzoate decarboxylase